MGLSKKELAALGGVGLAVGFLCWIFGGKKKDTPHKVFFSFHFAEDVMRVNLVRNIGAIHGNEPVSAQDWEQAGKTKGGIEKWIDENMADKDCVVVLIGPETHTRPWVKYEIKKAYKDKKGLIGIYIHNLECPRNGKSKKGKNPFEKITVEGKKLSEVISCYDPSPSNAYKEIAANLNSWVTKAI